MLISIGIAIGYYIVKAEPAVQVLNEQVEEITGGTVSYKMMNASLSIGVAYAVAPAMMRVLMGVSRINGACTAVGGKNADYTQTHTALYYHEVMGLAN